MVLESGSQAAWREVPVGELSRWQRAYCRVDGSLIWRWSTSLSGTAGPWDSALALRQLGHYFDALASGDDPFAFVTDMRHARWPGPEPEFAKVMPELYGARIGALARRCVRQGGIVIDDWTRPYWSGVNHVYRAPWPWALFTSSHELWLWLGVAPVDGDAIEALVERELARSPFVLTLSQLLDEHLDFDIVAAARASGVSVRSLQRQLSASGETFAGLRARIREARACRLLATDDAKIEAVALDVGFASVAHFGRWFRQRRGVTPSAFRAMVVGTSAAGRPSPG